MERPAAVEGLAFDQYVTSPSSPSCSRCSTRASSRTSRRTRKPRADLDAILQTGIPAGVVPGFQNYTGATKADMLRLNIAIPPSASPNPLGLVAGDAAGFPNGRRLEDDVVTIELRAIAGLTIPLVDPTYTPDGAASVVTDGTSNTNAALPARSRTWACPAAGTRPSPARRRVMGGHHGRELARRAGLGPARHRRRRRRPRGGDARGMLGVEVEVVTRHDPPGHHRPHVAVVPRPVAGGTVPSLVFPELVEGSYALVPKGTDDVRLRVDVRGGEVTSAVWGGSRGARRGILVCGGGRHHLRRPGPGGRRAARTGRGRRPGGRGQAAGVHEVRAALLRPPAPRLKAELGPLLRERCRPTAGVGGDGARALGRRDAPRGEVRRDRDRPAPAARPGSTRTRCRCSGTSS